MPVQAPIRTLAVLTLMALLLPLESNAQEPPAPSAAVYVERTVEALGGAEALAEIKTLRITGVEMFNGIESPFEILRQRPDKFRLTLETERGPRVVATDGSTVWSQGRRRDGSNAPQVLEGDGASRMLEENADFDGPLIGFADKGHTLEYVGDAEVDGTPAVHLRLTLASGHVQDWYLDRERGLVLQKTTPQVHRSGPYGRQWYFMEYQTVGGVAFPFYFEQEDRQHVRAMTVEAVEINPALDPSVFVLPVNADGDDS